MKNSIKSYLFILLAVLTSLANAQTAVDSSGKPINQTAESENGIILIRDYIISEKNPAPDQEIEEVNAEEKCLIPTEKFDGDETEPGKFKANLWVTVVKIVKKIGGDESLSSYRYEVKRKGDKKILQSGGVSGLVEVLREDMGNTVRITYYIEIPIPVEFDSDAVVGENGIEAILYKDGSLEDNDEASVKCSDSSCSPCNDCASSGANSVKIEVPVGIINNGSSKAYLRYYTQEIGNKGRVQLELIAPPNMPHTLTLDKSSYATIYGGSHHATISDTPTIVDPKAFTVSVSTDPLNIANTIVKSYLFENYYDNNTVKFRLVETDVVANKTWATTWEKSSNLTGQSVWVFVQNNGLKKQELTKLEETIDAKKQRRKSYIKDSSGNYQLVGDYLEREARTPSGWKKIEINQDPDGENLKTLRDYYEFGETTGPNASKAGYGRLKSITSPDGSVTNYQYTAKSDIIKKPFKGTPDAHVTTTIFDSDATTSISTKETKVRINDILVTHTKKIINGATVTTEIYTDGQQKLISVKKYFPTGHNFAGKLKSQLKPDGTVILYSYSTANKIRTSITLSGSPNATGDNLVAGTVTTKITNKFNQTVSSSSVDVESGLIISNMLNSNFDIQGRPLTTTYFPGETYAYNTSRTYGCCGLTSQTNRNGISKVYALDDLKRTVKTTYLGVTQETVYNGLTTSQHRYPENNLAALLTSSATPGNEITRSVKNLAGTYSESWSRTAKDGKFVKMSSSQTTYKPADNTTLSVREVTTLAKTDAETTAPTSTTETYLDGSTYQSYGFLQPHIRYEYGANATGRTSSVSYIDGTSLHETRSSQSDLAGRIVSSTLGINTTIQEYNTIGQMVKTTDADGVITLYEYNSEGEQVISIKDLNGNGIKDLAIDNITLSNYSYATRDGFTVLRSTSSLIKPGDSTFTELSRSESSIDSTHSWSTKFPNSANELTSSRVISYTGNGNIVTRINASNGTYRIQTVTAGLGAKLESFASDDSLISSIAYSYDIFNRPVTQTHSRTGAVTTIYQSDVSDTVVSTIDSGNRSTTVSYDLRGRQLSVDAPDTLDKDGGVLSNITNTNYLDNGKVGEHIGALTYRKTYTYDYALRMNTLTTYQLEGTNATGQTTTWNYDTTYGRLINKRDADNKGCDYTYTLAGRLKTKTLARGIVTTYAYDTAGRNTLTSHSDATLSVLTKYDRLSRPTKVDQGVDTNLHEYTYNTTTLALLSEKITYGANTSTPFVRTINHTQDSIFRSSGYTLNNGAIVEQTNNYGYDIAGRLRSVNNHQYDYLANSGGIIETITSPAHKVTNTYEANRNGLLSKQNTKLDTIAIAGHQYTLNNRGQRTSVTRNGLAYATPDVDTIGYDSTGQVVKIDNATNSAFNRNYGFDAIGNRLSDDINAYAVTTTNEIQSILKNADNSVKNITHDDDGNMLTGTLPEDSTGATLVWDAYNRLTQITKSNGDITKYAYDYQSRRISKTTAGVTTSYIYNGWNPIAKYTKLATTNWQLATLYTWGQDINGGIQSAGGVGGLLAVTKGVTEYYPLYDGNGNITDYIDSTGVVVAHYQYDVFGNTIVKTGAKSDDFAHRFSTKQRDTETGLYYYGYRYYDPQTGRWPSRDPIEERGGINLYAFVGNNSISYWDLLGLANISFSGDLSYPPYLTVEWSVGGEYEKKGSIHRLTASAELSLSAGIDKTFVDEEFEKWGVEIDLLVSAKLTLAKITRSAEITVCYDESTGELVVSGSTEATFNIGITAGIEIEGELEIDYFDFEVTVTGSGEMFAGGEAGLKLSAGPSGITLEGKAWLGVTYEGEVSASAEIGSWNPSTTLWDTDGKQDLFGPVGQKDYKKLWSHEF